MHDGILKYVSILNERHTVDRIIVTGHSLGGAIATMAAIDLYWIYGAKIKIINFGSPRVGNLAFHDYFKKLFGNDHVFRVVN